MLGDKIGFPGYILKIMFTVESSTVKNLGKIVYLLHRIAVSG